MRRTPSPGDVHDFFRAMQRPSLDGLNTFVVCRAVQAAGFKVALSGLGGDEATGGYSHFRYLRYLRGLAAASRVAPVRRAISLGGRAGRSRLPAKAHEMLGSGGPRDAWDLSLLQRQVWSRDLVVRGLGLADDADLVQEAPVGIGRLDSAALTAAEYRLYLQSTLLPDADAFSMASSVELRVPLVDRPFLGAAVGAGGVAGLGKGHFARARGRSARRTGIDAETGLQSAHRRLDAPGVAPRCTAAGESSGGARVGARRTGHRSLRRRRVAARTVALVARLGSRGARPVAPVAGLSRHRTSASVGRAMTPPMLPAKQSVADFWEREACGERYGAQQDEVRYQLEPEILRVAQFDTGGGQQVLEIGVGMGADLVRWARAGGNVTGVDLTSRAVELSRQRLEAEGLHGAVLRADAEHLPFVSGAFDVVWSWGVLHHTPDSDRALIEAARVVKPGGRFAVMVYHRRSWLAAAAWVRWGLLRGKPCTSLNDAVGHVESPGTRAYIQRELELLLRPHLQQLRVRPVLTHWDRRVAPGLARCTGNRFGWFLVVEGVKR